MVHWIGVGVPLEGSGCAGVAPAVKTVQWTGVGIVLERDGECPGRTLDTPDPPNTTLVLI
jgi:hypothetical protein